MEQKPQPLSYARPIETTDRPPMYSLIMTVVLASGLIFLGLIASAVFAVILYQGGGLFALIPLLVTALFLYMGFRSFRVALRFLRGKPPLDEHWDRWLFWIWMTRM